MKFLIDQNLSPEVAARLIAAGHDAVHTRDTGLQRASDEAVLDVAAREERVLVSADTDFGLLLARSGASSPSFIPLRRQGERRAVQQARLILDNVEDLRAELDGGSVVVFTDDRIRVRRLPLPPA